jgi:hypothetical protein
VTLEPGATHLMLIGLKAPFAEGPEVPLELRFDKAGVVKATIKVRARVPAGHEGHEHRAQALTHRFAVRRIGQMRDAQRGGRAAC